MDKMIGFDFEADSFVCVEAPEGTDPDTLIDAVIDKFKERIRERDFIVSFMGTYDPETGVITRDYEEGDT